MRAYICDVCANYIQPDNVARRTTFCLYGIKVKKHNKSKDPFITEKFKKKSKKMLLCVNCYDKMINYLLIKRTRGL